MKKQWIYLFAFLLCFTATGASAKIIIDPPPSLPPDLLASDIKFLTVDRISLTQEFSATQGEIDRQAKNCDSVEKGSPEAHECLVQVTAVKSAVKKYREDLQEFKANIKLSQSSYALVKDMLALSLRLNWPKAKIDRLEKALNDLGGERLVATPTQVREAWNAILARDKDGPLEREISQGEGPGVYASGTQTKFEDCTVFALATATGHPYGEVGANATQLISESTWHSADEQKNPQKVIESHGLNGGEVVMLAESFGQAEVIPRTAFAKTLKEGRPVMITVRPDHQVVLSRTFQRNGETWYEMMDSNQGSRRLYLSGNELSTIQQENGIAVRPERGTIPRLLR